MYLVDVGNTVFFCHRKFHHNWSFISQLLCLYWWACWCPAAWCLFFCDDLVFLEMERTGANPRQCWLKLIARHSSWSGSLRSGKVEGRTAGIAGWRGVAAGARGIATGRRMSAGADASGEGCQRSRGKQGQHLAWPWGWWSGLPAGCGHLGSNGEGEPHSPAAPLEPNDVVLVGEWWEAEVGPKINPVLARRLSSWRVFTVLSQR